MLRDVLEVKRDYDGATLGRCVRIRAHVNINKPLCRWTLVNIEGTPCHIIFRYKKLADLCYFYGRLSHLDKDCQLIQPDGKKYYGPWLWVNDQNPISMKEILMELDHLNSKLPDLPLN